MNKKIFVVFIFGILLLGSVSAGIFDNKFHWDEKQDYQMGNKLIKYNSLWDKYNPIEIKSGLFGLGSTKAKIALTEHAETCGGDNICISKMEIYLANDGVLIDDNKFYTLQKKGDWIEQDIRWSKFEYWGDTDNYETQCTKEEQICENYENGTFCYNQQETCEKIKIGKHKGWVNYNLGDEVKAGNYEVQLVGEKKPSRIVDWRIETQGKIISELAIWGNISEGDGAEVILNSPPDGFERAINEIGFSATANITGGATLVNMSLYYNSTGVWSLNETKLNSDNLTSAHGETMNGNHVRTNQEGIQIETIEAITIGNITRATGVSATTAYIYTYTDGTALGNLLASTNFSGDNATFNFFLNSSTKYYIVLDSEGGNTQFKPSSGTTFPITNEFIKYEIGWSGGIPNSNSIFGVESISREINTIDFTKSISEDIIWNVQGCDSDGDCGFAPSNFSLFSDTNSPTIDIESPTGTFNVLEQNKNISLNFTATDFVILGTCLLEYNLTNTTIPCTNATKTVTGFDYELGFNNLTIYANDSLNNVGSSFTSWTVILEENSQQFETSTTETAIENFNISLTYTPSDWNAISANINYDGTNYSGTQIGSGNNPIFTANIEIPSISEASENLTFFWYIDLTNTTGTFSFASSSNNQTVTEIALTSPCSGGDIPYITFFTRTSENPFPLLNATFKSAWDITQVGGGTTLSNFSYEEISETNSSWDFCISPNSTNYTVSVDVEVDATGYAKNFYYITDNEFTSGETTNISLYLLNDSLATPTTLDVNDKYTNPISEVLIFIQLYDVGTDIFYTVGMGKTNENGEDTVYLNWFDSLYKFVLVKNGETQLITNTTKIFATPKKFEISTTITYTFNKFLDFQYSLIFNNLTENFVLTYVKPDATIEQGCLRVTKRTTVNDTEICLTCSSSASATLYCNIGSAGNGTFLATFYATGSWYNVAFLVEIIGGNFATEINDLLGEEDAIFYTILMSGIVVSMFLFSPVLGVIGMILGLLASAVLGFTVITYSLFIGITIIGGFIIWILKK